MLHGHRGIGVAYAIFDILEWPRHPALDVTDSAANCSRISTCAARWLVRYSLQARLDSMSEMGEMESLRLQMAMDRLSKFMNTLSNLLKKFSDTASGIVQNLK
jgi:hypothetical protein